MKWQQGKAMIYYPATVKKKARGDEYVVKWFSGTDETPSVEMESIKRVPDLVKVGQIATYLTDADPLNEEEGTISRWTERQPDRSRLVLPEEEKWLRCQNSP